MKNSTGRGGKMEKATTPISIPTDLYKQIEKKLEELQANTVEEYIISLLKEKFPIEEAGISKEEEDKVKERLKALGYMD